MDRYNITINLIRTIDGLGAEIFAKAIEKSPLLKSILLKHLTLLVPSDAVIKFVLSQIGLDLQGFTENKIFQDIIKNHILLSVAEFEETELITSLNGNEFKYNQDNDTIDDIPITNKISIPTNSKNNQFIYVYGINGLISTLEQRKILFELGKKYQEQNEMNAFSDQLPSLAEIKANLKPIEDNFMLDDGKTSEKQGSWCRCILKVQAKGKVTNPYAICSKSVGTSYRYCSESYDFYAMDLPILNAWCDLHQVNSKNKTREEAIRRILQYKLQKYPK